MNDEKVSKRLLAPVLAGFFIMGFCDIVAPITAASQPNFPPGSRKPSVSCPRWSSCGF